uniref:DUF4960 domain-containing protein n=1 Tax=Segatella hominis TaxID=2518605 RepID=UPI0040386A75
MKKILFMLMAILALTACSDDNVSDLNLSGSCSITELALDNYDGAIDKTTRTITVRVPETYDISQMSVTKLSLSDGAKSNVNVNDQLNMSAPQAVHVTNGDVYLYWTIKAQRDEAKITSFKINDTYVGTINEDTKTIMVYVPASLDIKKLTPTIAYSENATISPASGIAADFTNPVTYTVTNNTASNAYTVTVKKIDKPQALYVGLAQSMDELNIEEKTACNWMLQNVPNSLYASFTDIKNGSVDLSDCKVIWWHFHKDGGVVGKSNIEKAAPEALEAIPQMKDFYKNGGSFLFTRYATNMPGELGIAKNGGVPNNCWGKVEADAETCNGPWDFKMNGHTDHALYQNLVKGDDANSVYTTDTNYRITNSVAQWHIGSDWGGYADYAAWREATGGIDLGYGGDGAIVVWEFPAEGTSGKTLCIGSGCYDWYSVNEHYTEKFHKNIAIMTANAFNYLMNK